MKLSNDMSKENRARGFNLGGKFDKKDKIFNEPDVVARRAVAYIIDIVILSFAVPISWFFLIVSFGILSPLIMIVMFLLPLAYHSLMISSSISATLGQRFMGIKTVSKDGGAVDLFNAIILVTIFYVSIALTGGFILIWCLFDDRQRCLHDILASTIIIRNV